jgi:hypothetical protein
MKKERRFVINGLEKKISFDTYEECCNYVDRLSKEEILKCSVIDTEFIGT